MALISTIGPSWYAALQQEFNNPSFVQLMEYIASQRAAGIVYPPPDQMFTWTQMCPIYQVKVVILGQDPYIGPGQAHGLAFSVPPGMQIPPSLKNIYKELSTDINDFIPPGHGTLNGWAQQGVLLLNACLTVRANKSNSHAGQGWEQLTDAVISWLNVHMTGIVFMLWGAYAQKKIALIDQTKHHVLMAPHPSPMSARRGFIGCGHFSECNRLLESQGKTPINWSSFPH